MRYMLAVIGFTVLMASPALAQGCRTEIDSLNADLQTRYPELFKTAGETQQANAATDNEQALSGDPALSTEVPTAEDVPSSVMPGAAPEIEQEEEDEAAASSTSSTTSTTSAGTAPALSQDQVDKIQTLRALAEERLGAGNETECSKAVSDARSILEEQ